MKIQFSPHSFQYRMQGSTVMVHLYSKVDGDAVCVSIPYQPFFYAKVSKEVNLNIEVADAKVIRWEEVQKDLLGKQEPFYKIYVNTPPAVPIIAKELESQGIICFEKDILFVHRFLRDNNILPFAALEAEGEFKDDGSMRIPVFIASKITNSGTSGDLTSLKVLAIDLETYAKTRVIDPGKNPILMIGIVGVTGDSLEKFQKVLTWKKFKHDLAYVEAVSDEATMIERLREILLDYQPDIITTYNGDSFDWPYLHTRAEKFDIDLDLGVDRSWLLLRQDARINGILHLDLYQFIRRIFGRNLKTASYSLDAVSFELLGHKKHDVDLDLLHHAWDSDASKLPEYCEYNLHDAELTLKLCQKLLPDIIAFSQMVGLPAFDVSRMSFSRLVESYIMKRGVEYNILAPNRPSKYETERRREETYEGGFVFQPDPGLYHNIVVLDFRSLYPSIITAHNIGPEGLQCSCCQDRVPGLEKIWFCKEKKFLPSILEELILRRADVKDLLMAAEGQEKLMFEARSYALKLLANSFYGYLGFFGARWYCFPCAQATTAYARDYIQGTIKKATQAGFKVIYADTDSCFLLLGDKKLKDALVFMKEINSSLPGRMELEFEGDYDAGLFVALKGQEKGAKKKYALRKNDGSIKITGFETVRRNWSSLAKDVQRKVLDLILSDQVDEAIFHVRRVAEDLKAGRINNDKLIISTKLTRALDKYASVGPHVKVAREMQAEGRIVTPGTLVNYIIAAGSGIVREKAKMPTKVKQGSYDVDYYLTHQLIPAVESIFLVVGHSAEEIFTGSKQAGLGDFI